MFRCSTEPAMGPGRQSLCPYLDGEASLLVRNFQPDSCSFKAPPIDVAASAGDPPFTEQ